MISMYELNVLHSSVVYIYRDMSACFHWIMEGEWMQTDSSLDRSLNESADYFEIQPVLISK